MLYVVPTPIGNLEDVTLRAVRLFKEAQVIICEDSRQTRKLMTLLGVENKPRFVDLTRNHEYNWKGVEAVLDELKAQNQPGLKSSKLKYNEKTEKSEDLVVLLVSDSGMPGISDPGRKVVEMAIAANIDFTVLPGPSALISAAVASGIVKKDFEFVGFLPIKKGRQTIWKLIQDKDAPVVIYESSHRIKKFLEELRIYLEPERKICVCNDISKMYEKFWRFPVKNAETQNIPEKGEFAIIIDGKR